MENNMKKVLSIITLVLCIGGISGCSMNGSQAEPSGIQMYDIEPESNTSEVVSSESGDAELTDEDNELTEISTPYGTLYFPTEWADNVITDEENGDSSYSITFSTEINGANYELFTVVIGETEENGVIGTITGEDGVGRDVLLEVYDLGDMSGLSENEQNQIYAMQEALNIVVENLQ